MKKEPLLSSPFPFKSGSAREEKDTIATTVSGEASEQWQHTRGGVHLLLPPSPS